ncbi:MAG: FkbM family methyltransferase, partial [Chitinophagaceae bacterium]|nr:FkbM family methyltransferase [Chitinophagaceae bacterium]
EPINELPVAYHFTLKQRGDPLYLRTLSGDLDIFYELFWKRAYNYPGLICDTAAVIIDLGAHVGISGLFFLNKCADAVIYAVEPAPANFSLLCKNHAKAIAAGKIRPLQAAINDKDGYLGLKNSLFSYNNKTIAAVDNEPQVKAISLNTLVREYGITRVDILKIDIEGAESPLFSGSLDWLPLVRQIIMELHSVEDEVLCLNVLTRNGFRIHALKSNGTDRLFFATRLL